jgi:16S rRNA pseudouridine516 synthase
VAPVGRLDIDVTGLLLLTGDGVLAHRLASPKWEVDKTYRVAYDGPEMTDVDVAVFASGLPLSDGTLCRPARLEPREPGLAMLTIHEGRFHQVKNMMRASGRTVTTLIRERMGPLVLDSSLTPGMFRMLTEKETDALYAAVSLHH